jgi:small conductance mechanosensitive channel
MTQNPQWMDDLTERANTGWVGTSTMIVFLVVLAVVLNTLARVVIDRIVRRAEAGVLPGRVQSAAAAGRRLQRARTAGSLIKSSITGLIALVFGTIVLAQIGVNIAPIVASAGIVGLALGFGAQSLVKDYLSGIFMIFEDQYGVGDRVQIGAASTDVARGTVESVSLRITTLRDDAGTIWHVRNGEILRVGNESQGITDSLAL